MTETPDKTVISFYKEVRNVNISVSLLCED